MQTITRKLLPTLLLLFAVPATAQSFTRISVVDQTGADIPNILLVSHQPGKGEKNIVLTDNTGHAVVSGLSCTLCAVTAIDPKGLFTTTTEFASKACCLRIVMNVHPIIDRVFLPGQ